MASATDLPELYGPAFNKAVRLAKAETGITYDLKEKQLEVLHKLYRGCDTVALLPTGYGKSLIYQLSPFILKHRPQWTGTSPITIVITPLNAIMNEQLVKLGEMGISACGLGVDAEKVKTWAPYSYDDDLEDEETADEGTQKHTAPNVVLTNGSMEDVRNGKYNIIYAHPEALLSSKEGQTLLRSKVYQENVCCVAIDEGHLVLHWGETFRTDFLRLCEVVALFESVPHLVLTATASPDTVKVIQKKLQLRKPVVVNMNPNRANIMYKKVQRDNDNIKGLLEILESLATELVEQAEDFPLTVMYTDLQSIQFAYRYFKHVVPDWAGYSGNTLEPETRRYAQYHKQYHEEMKLHIIQDLSRPTPVTRIVFATMALGMGLDARSIRRIIHFKTPTTLEQYMQETGRAGRDSQPAIAVIYYNSRDLRKKRKGMTDDMRDYCKSTDQCLRELLLTHFGHVVDPARHSPSCCGSCVTKVPTA